MRGEEGQAREYLEKSYDLYSKMGIEGSAAIVQGWIDGL